MFVFFLHKTQLTAFFPFIYYFFFPHGMLFFFFSTTTEMVKGRCMSPFFVCFVKPRRPALKMRQLLVCI